MYCAAHKVLSCVRHFRGNGRVSRRYSEAEHYRFVRPPRNNALTRDRGWKTHVLLLPGDGNEIHETSRVTSSFVCLRSGLSRCAVIGNTETRGARECTGRSTAHRRADFILDYIYSPKRETHANVNGDPRRLTSPIPCRSCLSL